MAERNESYRDLLLQAMAAADVDEFRRQYEFLQGPLAPKEYGYDDFVRERIAADIRSLSAEPSPDEERIAARLASVTARESGGVADTMSRVRRNNRTAAGGRAMSLQHPIGGYNLLQSTLNARERRRAPSTLDEYIADILGDSATRTAARWR